MITMSTNLSNAGDDCGPANNQFDLGQSTLGMRPLALLLWWVTVEEWDRFVDGELSAFELRDRAVDRADAHGAPVVDELRDGSALEAIADDGGGR